MASLIKRKAHPGGDLGLLSDAINPPGPRPSRIPQRSAPEDADVEARRAEIGRCQDAIVHAAMTRYRQVLRNEGSYAAIVAKGRREHYSPAVMELLAACNALHDIQQS